MLSSRRRSEPSLRTRRRQSQKYERQKCNCATFMDYLRWRLRRSDLRRNDSLSLVLHYHHLRDTNQPSAKPMPRLISICVQFQLLRFGEPLPCIKFIIIGPPPSIRKATTIIVKAIKYTAVRFVVAIRRCAIIFSLSYIINSMCELYKQVICLYAYYSFLLPSIWSARGGFCFRNIVHLDYREWIDDIRFPWVKHIDRENRYGAYTVYLH